MTSPLTDLVISVTSSGRSSIRRTIKILSGLFFSMECAMLWSSKVFPALGGETIKPLCPFPVGEIKSIILADKSSVVPLPDSITNLSSGNKGVKFSNANFDLVLSVPSKFISSIFNRAKYLSPSFGGLIFPEIESPVLSPNLLI